MCSYLIHLIKPAKALKAGQQNMTRCSTMLCNGNFNYKGQPGAGRGG